MNKFLLIAFVVLVSLSLSFAPPGPAPARGSSAGDDDDESCGDEQTVGDICGEGKTCQAVNCSSDIESEENGEIREKEECELVCMATTGL